MTPPLKVFISYAHEDEPHRATLGSHLSALVREGLIELWHDRMITGGREWAGAIDDALKQADIVLLLISADFLDSDYCNDVELTEAIRMHDVNLARVVPVNLRSCDWQHSRFARFNALPPDGAPAVEAEHPDQRYTEIARGLRAVVAELCGAAGAPNATGQAEPTQPVAAPPSTQSNDAAASPPRARRVLHIAEINLGIIKLGPLDIPLPNRGAKPALWVMALLLLAGAGTWYFALYAPISQAREAMRMARYDSALEELKAVPDWLSAWPVVRSLRQHAALGVRFQSQRPNWEDLGRELRRFRKMAPNDADLLVLDATYWLRQEDYGKVRDLATAATQADERNAEAWFMRGLLEDLAGNLALAENHYRKATLAAPDSPQYRNNLAHVLFDTRRLDEAITEYRKISQFPLARLEQALIHWTKGEMALARDAQWDALKMLEDRELMKHSYNLRSWVFTLVNFPLPNNEGVRLIKPVDKFCYARLAEAASRRLVGEASATFPPADCAEPPVEIRQLVADDLCRYVDTPQPGLAEIAAELRRALNHPTTCPVPAAAPAAAQI